MCNSQPGALLNRHVARDGHAFEDAVRSLRNDDVTVNRAVYETGALCGGRKSQLGRQGEGGNDDEAENTVPHLLLHLCTIDSILVRRKRDRFRLPRADIALLCYARITEH